MSFSFLLVAVTFAVLFLQNKFAFSYPSAPTSLVYGNSHKISNVSALLEERTSLNSLGRRDVIGTGICATAMSRFGCDMSNHEQNRCAGDDWSYCICAGGANGAGAQGLWLNTAWGPGCYACYDKERGYEFDGTCHGDGTGGEGQQISDIMATLTVTVVVVEYTSGAERGTRIRRFV